MLHTSPGIFMLLQAANYRFGPYELRTRTRELYKQGSKLKLRLQPFQVLRILVERAGDVVTREELCDLLWSKETFVDFEHGLNTLIKELRGVLSDSASEPRYIETVPKLGYRIIVSVEVDEPLPVNQAIAQPQTAAAENLLGQRTLPDRTPRVWAVRRWPVLIGLTIGLIAGLSGYIHWSRSRVRSQPGGRLMLAVLPFENLTGDAGQDYFSDGLTEEMIAQLGRLDPQRLGVIARTSVMHYKHGQEQLEQIGRELGVQYVLEGSVRRDADKVRITAQLIQMKDQTRLWARQYDRELSNLLALQGEIAQEIAGGIQLTLGDHKRIDSAHQASLSPNAYEAYDLYLKGRYFWNKRTPQGFQRAVEYFQQATEKDPTYAPAYAGLADSYALMSGYNMVSPREIMPKARAAALRAVELDDKLAEAHTSLAVIAQNYDWDWKTVEKEYRRAIELDPNYPTAHHWYAESLALEGRFDEAFVEIERARQLDPLSLIIATDYGAILYFSRQYDRAIKQLRAVLDMEPNFPRAHILVGAYVQKGMYAEALADIERWRRIEDNPWSWMMLAYVYGRSGQQEKARSALEKLEELNRRGETDSASIALAHLGMGDKEKAIAWLQKAYAEHSIPTALKVDPIYDPLRSDPRFQELLRRVGLAE
jgi:TolB-like protein/DNA-binding winged helix-turn-helix (wHTH) protein/Flp pilus assembly protein TadD